MRVFRKHIRLFSVVSGLTMVFQLFVPVAGYAVTGHDTMPEYTGFTPYSTTDMVNLSDGSFTYNLPLMEIPGGYPINLAYNSSSVSPQAMASWVGLGSLNWEMRICLMYQDLIRAIFQIVTMSVADGGFSSSIAFLLSKHQRKLWIIK